MKHKKPLKPHLAPAFWRSHTRPGALRGMDPELLDIWQCVVFGAMRDGGKTREEAEQVAWADIDMIRASG